jgi:PncC family amidohydrolase
MDETERVPDMAALVALAGRIQLDMSTLGLTLATAESCTGGLIAYALTEISGSSDYFVGGIVSYSNALKERELGVDSATLKTHGAVSAQTCVAMAQGARRRYEADIAVSVTGSAGPAGGTDSKPVGLTYVGVADERGNDVRRFVWDADRHGNKLLSAHAAMALVLERLDTRRR